MNKRSRYTLALLVVLFMPLGLRADQIICVPEGGPCLDIPSMPVLPITSGVAVTTVGVIGDVFWTFSAPSLSGTMDVELPVITTGFCDSGCPPGTTVGAATGPDVGPNSGTLIYNGVDYTPLGPAWGSYLYAWGGLATLPTTIEPEVTVQGSAHVFGVAWCCFYAWGGSNVVALDIDSYGTYSATFEGNPDMDEYWVDQITWNFGPTVPEPGTLSLLVTGLLGIAGLRRRFL
jgi:hypothetical protein